jgi:alkaline phosphatase D
VTLFRHGVASGDPATDRVVIWTRAAVDNGRPVRLNWTLAADPDLRAVVASGELEATADTDHTAQVDVDGLKPNTHYWYAFESDGERSTIGRTRTLPADPDRIRFAAVSCAKYNAGFFNGYGRIAERDDLNFVMHLGDFIYELAQNPPANQTPGADIGRPFDPLNECVRLDDYRRRYAQYRADPDTLALSQAHPLLATLDDHEIADGQWRGGSDNHDPARDGPWEVRREAAFRARREWLPQRLPDPSRPDRVWRLISFGALADLFLLDTRSMRDQPLAGVLAADPGRTQLGPEQRLWLFDGIAGSTARWQLLGNSSVLGQTWAPNSPKALYEGLRWLKLNGKDGGPDADQWDGYPVERALLLEHLRDRDAVVLSGDVHVALAIELDEKRTPEFVTASLTSQNLDDKTGWGYRTESVEVEKNLVAALNDIIWCDLDDHGYMVIDVTPERVAVEHWFVDTVLKRSKGEHMAAGWEVRPGSGHITRIGGDEGA